MSMWTKRGRVWCATGQSAFLQRYAMMPTPSWNAVTGLITIYFAATDTERCGRIFAVDVAPADPTRVIAEPNPTPVLDLGEPGMFDDCGVNPSSIVDERLYYVGYQRTERMPFLLLSGAAERRLAPQFTRVQRTPILERTDREPWIRAAPFVLRRGDVYHLWYISSSSLVDGKPRYMLNHALSADGLSFTHITSDILPLLPEETAIARPWVVEERGVLRLWFSVATRGRGYRIGYAESHDGKSWRRIGVDQEPTLDVSADGWDSETIGYAAVITVDHIDFMFYCGNAHGATGFGVATRPHAGPHS